MQSEAKLLRQRHVSNANFFELFGLPAQFVVDLAQLDSAYKRVQAQVHPDRFAAAGAAERRVAMQWATRANEAFQTLKSPLKRAAYLCEQNGVPIGAESNTAMPPAFLMQQMEWRERLDAARSDKSRAQQLLDEVTAARSEVEQALADALDRRRDYAAAAAMVRQFMFIEKFRAELAALGDVRSTG